MNFTFTQDIGYIYSDKLIPIHLNAENTLSSPAEDVTVKLKEIPEGVSYVSNQLSRGEFIVSELLWNVGYVGPRQIYDGILTFQITDPSKSSFSFDFIVGSECEACDDVITYCITYTGISSTELVAAGLVVVSGTYDDDADAALGGVDIGGYYLLSSSNTYGLPEGHPKQRVS